MFSTYEFHNAGVDVDKPKPDEGRKMVTKRDEDLGAFRASSLRDVAQTSPYFHDGTAKTLEEAVALMAGGGKDNPHRDSDFDTVRKAKLTAENRKDLVISEGPHGEPPDHRSTRPPMNQILQKRELAPKIHEFVVEAPRVARKARPGHFVIVMADERGERIPLTIADFDRERGTVTLVLMVVGASTMNSRLAGGSALCPDWTAGPSVGDRERGYGNLGRRRCGNRTHLSHRSGVPRARLPSGDDPGARSKELLFWIHRVGSVSDEHIITTDDGSFGRKGLVTEPLREALAGDAERRSAVSMPSDRRS